MNFKKVKLTTGKEVAVYAPPVLRIYSMLAKKYPEPQKRTVTEKTITGTVTVVIEDDPVYEQEVLAWERKIDEESQELNILFALKDEVADDEFDMESTLSILRYSNPDAKARGDGKNERKLDWIEWELLANPVDANRVQEAINSLISVDMEVVEQIEQSFPGKVEGSESQ